MSISEPLVTQSKQPLLPQNTFYLQNYTFALSLNCLGFFFGDDCNDFTFPEYTIKWGSLFTEESSVNYISYSPSVSAGV